MYPLTLDDPIERIVLLASASPADRILGMAGGVHQDVLAALEDAQAKTIVRAYQQAQSSLTTEMKGIWAKSFGAGVQPTPAQTLRFLQASELAQSVEKHLSDLDVLNQASLGQSWAQGAKLGFDQANVELAHAVADFGGAGIVGRSVFGHLDTLAYDLGMTAAINDTKNLIPEVRLILQRELQAGAIAGEGIRDLTARLAPLEGVGARRAEMISRWGVIKGHNASRDQAYNDAAKVIPGLQKMWLVTSDERTCPNCLAHYGEVVPVDGEFGKDRSFAPTPVKVYGDVLEYPPLHPRCRCTIVAWHERWRSLASFTPERFQEDAQKLAHQAGFPPKTFAPTKQTAHGLRATRSGRAVLRASNIASTPKSVVDAAMSKYHTCWVGGTS